MRNTSIRGGSGVVRAVRLLGDPVLDEPCAPVTVFDAALVRLVEDMYATMYAHRGVGLAANQVGVGLRVLVYDCPDDEDRRHLGHLVNPELVRVDGVTVRGAESCLSLPGVEGGTPRADRVEVAGVDVRGAPLRVAGEGFFARCLQHECDHLDGRLYPDRLAGWRRRRVLRAAGRARRAEDRR